MPDYRVPSRKLSFDDAVSIWIDRITTGEFQNRIASQYDTNPGRVNEVLKGKRHPGARKAALIRLGHSNDNDDDGGDSGPDQPTLL